MKPMNGIRFWPTTECRLGSATWMLVSLGWKKRRSKRRWMQWWNASGATRHCTSRFQCWVLAAPFQHRLSDMLRYPLLIIKGASASGKMEFAKSLFHNPLELKVGNSEVFPIQNGGVSARISWCTHLGWCAWHGFLSPAPGEAPGQIRRAHRVCNQLSAKSASPLLSYTPKRNWRRMNGLLRCRRGNWQGLWPA